MKTSQEQPDNCLLKHAAKGDKQAFGLLYQKYLNEIYRFVYYKTGNEGLSEDLTEETFIRTWERLINSHDDERSINHLRAWLYRTANNLVIDYYRKRKPVQLIEKLTRSKQPLPEEVTESKDISELLMESIKALKPEFQQIIILRFINQLSHDETAAIMKISPGYSRVLQFRALKKLKANLTKRVGQHVQ